MKKNIFLFLIVMVSFIAMTVQGGSAGETGILKNPLEINFITKDDIVKENKKGLAGEETDRDTNSSRSNAKDHEEIKKMLFKLRKTVVKKDRKSFNKMFLVMDPRTPKYNDHSRELSYLNTTQLAHLFNQDKDCLDTVNYLISKSDQFVNLASIPAGSDALLYDFDMLIFDIQQIVQNIYGYDVPFGFNNIYFLPGIIFNRSFGKNSKANISGIPYHIIIKIYKSWINYSILASSKELNQLEMESYLKLAYYRYKNHDCTNANNLLSSVYQINNNSRYLQALSWVYGTCPDESLTDGAKAIYYAKKALEMMPKNKISRYYSALASAFARDKLFEKAVVTQKKAITFLVKEQGEWRDWERRMKRYQHRLELYKQNQPYTEPFN